MELAQLRLFTQIVRDGSLTKASITLDLDQSVISRQLHSLENTFGGQLFHRTGRGMRLTDFGLSVLPKINSLLEQAERVEDEIRAEAGVLRGSVKLGILPAFSYPLAINLFKKIKVDHPEIELQLYEGSNGQLSEWVGNGRVDLALMYLYGSVESSAVKVLGLNEAHLISRFDDPLTAEAEISFEQLEGRPLTLPSAPNSLRETLTHIASQKGIELNVVLEADSLPIQKDLVADGTAYAILGAVAIRRERKMGLLRSSRIIDPPISRSAVLAVSSQKSFSSAMRAVCRVLEPIAQKMFQDDID